MDIGDLFDGSDKPPSSAPGASDVPPPPSYCSPSSSPPPSKAPPPRLSHTSTFEVREDPVKEALNVYSNILAVNLQTGEKFLDPDFLPSARSLYGHDHRSNLAWIRASQSP